MLEPWPTEEFVSADHLRAGYDEENGKRVGKVLARALGIAPKDGGPVTESEKSAETIDVGALAITENWHAEGAGLVEGEGPARRVIETVGPGVHYVERSRRGLTPGKIVRLAFYAKAIGARGVFVELRTGGRRGSGYCDLPGGTAQRDGDMLDAGIEPAPQGWWRCWVAMPVEAPDATLRLSLMNERLDPFYSGDGESGAGISPLELSETTRFLAQEPSPW
jgi:hypothetical protein